MHTETTEELVEMARAASHDERLSDGMLYRKLADEIERLDGLLESCEAYAAGWDAAIHACEKAVREVDEITRG